MIRAVTPVAVDSSSLGLAVTALTGYGVGRCLKVLAPAPLLIVLMGSRPRQLLMQSRPVADFLQVYVCLLVLRRHEQVSLRDACGTIP